MPPISLGQVLALIRRTLMHARGAARATNLIAVGTTAAVSLTFLTIGTTLAPQERISLPTLDGRTHARLVQDLPPARDRTQARADANSKAESTATTPQTAATVATVHVATAAAAEHAPAAGPSSPPVAAALPSTVNKPRPSLPPAVTTPSAPQPPAPPPAAPSPPTPTPQPPPTPPAPAPEPQPTPAPAAPTTPTTGQVLEVATPPATPETSEPTPPPPEPPEQSHATPTTDKPGWGFGDKNHNHTGPPGKTGEH